MKRYDLVTNYRAGSRIEEMEPADDGEWLRYEEVASLESSLLRMTEERDALRATLRGLPPTFAAGTIQHQADELARLTEAHERLKEAARVALNEMCNTVAPRNSFTDAADVLDALLALPDEKTAAAVKAPGA